MVQRGRHLGGATGRCAVGCAAVFTAMRRRLPENVTASPHANSIFLRLSGSVLGSSSGCGDLGLVATRVAAFPEQEGKSSPEVAFCLGTLTDEARLYGLSGTDRSRLLRGSREVVGPDPRCGEASRESTPG